MLRRLTAAVVLSTSSWLVGADAVRVTVDPARVGVAISPTLYGIFFEEISRAGDGGLYAEMLQNRSFEDAQDRPEAWTPVGEATISLDKSEVLNQWNRTAVKVEVRGEEPAGIANDGFAFRRGDDRAKRPEQKGMGLALKAGEKYRLSLYARGDQRVKTPLVARLVSRDGKELAKVELGKPGAKWGQMAAELSVSETDPAGRLVIQPAGPGPATVWLDQVSLMPADTWKGLPLRKDLGEMIAAMRPAFVRFPGGCFVEGYSIDTAARWKESIGDPAERPGHGALWGYRTTSGLGFHEFLQWCEALNAEPLYVINVGMTHGGNVPMGKMPQWVQDAVDMVEYARGPVTSVWGAARARAGHPEPFKFNYIEIGNENGGPAYAERYALFHDALKAKYPDVHLIANHWDGGFPKNRPVGYVDEHMYADPGTFIRQNDRFDKYDRSAHKVYMGEYAVTSNCGTGNLRAAVAESVFMLGMERNSDVVTMSSYAPLLAHVGQKAWNPDAIYYDQARAYGTPSYYAQCLLAQNQGDVNLTTDVQADDVVLVRSGVAGVGTWQTQAQFKDVKVTQGDKTLYASDFAAGMKDLKPMRGKWNAVDGVLEQTALENDCRIVVGQKDWRDYTLTLKAKKTGGREGFLILFTSGDGGEQCWWNLGGWGNQRHGLEFGAGAVNEVTGSIETGKWYDIRVEAAADKVRCYLDGKLLHEVAWPTQKSVYAQASRVEKSGDVIVKLVNTSDTPHDVRIGMQGGGKYAGEVAVEVMSGSPEDENSFENPTKVAPKQQSAKCADGAVSYTAPGSSVSVLRLREVH